MAKIVLRDKHRIAVHAFLTNGGVKADAMRTAGYSENTSKDRADIVFNRPEVIAFIAQRRAEQAEKMELSEDWVIKRLMRIADSGSVLAKYKVIQSDGTLAWDFTAAPDEDLALINELSVDTYTEGRGPGAIRVKKFKIKTGDAFTALNALARVLGIFDDKLEVSGASLIERLHAGRKRLGKEDNAETLH